MARSGSAGGRWSAAAGRDTEPYGIVAEKGLDWPDDAAPCGEPPRSVACWLQLIPLDRCGVAPGRDGQPARVV